MGVAPAAVGSETAHVPRVDRRARLLRRLAGMPGAVEDYPFGEDTAVFRVGSAPDGSPGRMFALVSLTGAIGWVNLKLDPALVTELVATHRSVAPGWHMSKRHWVTVTLDTGMDDALLAELVEHSYALVVAKLPARLRPPKTAVVELR